MGKTVTQLEREWATHGNIARLMRALELEPIESRRTWLEGLLKEQRELVSTYEV
jgi:hypothetical protein